MKRIFVTGISTEVGKTIVSAVITEALQADYWKPVQAGDLSDSDSHKIARLISNEKSVIHQNSYALTRPMSPHAAASLDDVSIELEKIVEPDTSNSLVIEGAGGLMVPLNQKDTILDLIKPEYKVVVVSQHYLGSINHSLLTLEKLREKNLNCAVIFNGAENPHTEEIIALMSGVKILGRINKENNIDRAVVRRYANFLRPAILSL